MAKKPPLVKAPPIKTVLSKYPDLAPTYFDTLQKAGATAACLFGGALRDTDCSHFYGMTIPVNDYDMRVWLPSTNYEQQVKQVVRGLARQGAQVTLMPNADNDVPFYDPLKPRYEVIFPSGKMDLSFRLKPFQMFLRDENLSAHVAQDRAFDSDIGLSAIAMDNTNTVWVLQQYLEDRAHLRLSVFPTDHDDRSIAYAERLKQKKYQLHGIVAPK